MKQFWTEPQIIEIQVRRTEDNKIGPNPDMYSNTVPICGEIIDGPPCCS